MRQIHLVGLLQAYNSSNTARPILNAAKTELHMATGYNLTNIETKISVYPNPVSDMTIIDFGNKVDTNSSLEIWHLLRKGHYQQHPTNNQADQELDKSYS